MNEKVIWDFLKSKGMTDYGVAGLMGNLYAESGLRSNNLQNSSEKKFGLTDEQYTHAVDIGAHPDFAHDSAGYGLAQWTYWTRKQALLDYARKHDASIGDLYMQLEFLWYELSHKYSGVLKSLAAAQSVREASDVVMTKYEKPANQSEAAKQKRARYGQGYYNTYAEVKSIYYPVPQNYTGRSIVDGLRSIGVDSSYSTRSKIAKANDIASYIGLGRQNTQMLNLLKEGKLKKI